MIGIFHYALVLLAIPISIVLFVLFMRCKVSIQLITAVLWLIPPAYEYWTRSNCLGECKCEEADGRFSAEISSALAIRHAHLAGEHVRRSVGRRHDTATTQRRDDASRSAVADRARKRSSEWAAPGASHLGWRSTRADVGVPRAAVRSSSDASSHPR